jgi:hypothetical protein
MSEHDDKIAHLQAVADMLNISIEALLATQAGALNRIESEAEEAENVLPPPPIVYPNIKYKKYVYREYPKLFYRGYIQDVEQTETRIVRDENGGISNKIVVRVIPDQFVCEYREVKNRVEEMSLDNDNRKLALGKQWLNTHAGARDAAIEAKKHQKPIVEREPTAAELKRAEAAAKAEAQEALALLNAPEPKRGRPSNAAKAAKAAKAA